MRLRTRAERARPQALRAHVAAEIDTAFIEWWATFDCAVDEYDRWIDYFENKGFATWLGALRQFMAEGRAGQRA